MALPDRSRSRAVLFAVPEYDSKAELSQLPGVAKNVDALRSVLIDPELGGFASTHCVPVAPDSQRDDFLDVVGAAAQEAADLLLVYYAGHGHHSADGQRLMLSTKRTTLRPLVRSVPYEDLRELVRASRARQKVIILDCCFSGHGVHMSGDLAREFQIGGAYVLASSPRTKKSLARANGSLFTLELVDVLRSGLSGPLDDERLGEHQQFVRMDDLFVVLKRRMMELRKDDLEVPVPENLAVNEGARIQIVANKAYAPTSPHPVTTTVTKGDRHWPAVEKDLRSQGWPDDAISSLDDSSTKIVSRLNHPKEPAFQSRGLVVGYEQSGKTTSVTAVVAKAADRGYKFVIVLSGIHNVLNSQTLRHLEQELVGPNQSDWHVLAGPDDGFVPPRNPAAFFGKASGPGVLCVVKKNAAVLRKLAAWLRRASQYLVDTPALIIDYEPDQATVAAKTINPLIKQIIDVLPKNVYLGYTVTPFVNLLIDPAAKDLYPRDFIVSLPRPPGYVGTEVIVGRDMVDGEDPDDVFDGYDMVRVVPEDDVEYIRPSSRAELDTFMPTLIGSLRDAIDYFLLTTAARRVRGTGNKHSTMFIHTSVNTAVHNSFKTPLLDRLADISSGIESGSALDSLRTLWDRENKRVPAEEFDETGVPFDDLLVELPSVVRSCRVVVDNSSSEDRLDYENDPVVAIAVGGNTLSRGLILEGLAVSYFVRTVSAHDTLLQMSRWFGLCNGYADLMRIWMTDELASWFRRFALVEHEMRADIERYTTEDLTPLDLAVRFQTHPALLATARAKMKDVVIASASYGGQRLQTHLFSTDLDSSHGG